jgi:hypothetical protein
MANIEKKKYRVGGMLAGKTLIIENGYLELKDVYSHNFRVPIQDITTVAVDSVGWGKGMLKIIGHGTELAKVKLPLSWANKAQEWILQNK